MGGIHKFAVQKLHCLLFQTSPVRPEQGQSRNKKVIACVSAGVRNVCGGAGRGVLDWKPGNPLRKQADATRHKQANGRKRRKRKERRQRRKISKKWPSARLGAKSDLVIRQLLGLILCSDGAYSLQMAEHGGRLAVLRDLGRHAVDCCTRMSSRPVGSSRCENMVP